MMTQDLIFIYDLIHNDRIESIQYSPFNRTMTIVWGDGGSLYELPKNDFYRVLSICKQLGITINEEVFLNDK